MSLPDAEHLIKSLKDAVKTITESQSSLFSVTGKLITLPNCESIIVGDLHGDYSSLQYILMKTWFKERIRDNEPVVLVCMGDYIDRGPGQVEVLYNLSQLLIEYPQNVVLLRGNHEGPSDVGVSPHDFPYMLHRLYDEKSQTVYEQFRAFADQLYTAAISPNRALILHGGIPVGSQGLNDIANAHRTHPETDNLRQILWNDPMTDPGIARSMRGIGYLFGPDVARRFLDAIGVQVLIRGHQSSEQGHYAIGDIHTLFSCKLPNYGNKKAAYIELPMATTAQVENFSNYVKTF
jgi:protein phosphatase